MTIDASCSPMASKARAQASGDTPKRRTHQRRRRRQIAPVVDPALGVIDDIGTGFEHHAERVGSRRRGF